MHCGVPVTLQGDEHDVIFGSMVIVSNHDFRKLTELEAQQHFKVTISRARDQVWLFHSVKLHELNRQDLGYRLLSYFLNRNQETARDIYEDLQRRERAAKLSRSLGQPPEPYASWFAVDVALELWRRHYRRRPQVPAAGYRMDLVVEGLAQRLAAECDGEFWHGPEQFESDMARQPQLARVG